MMLVHARARGRILSVPKYIINNLQINNFKEKYYHSNKNNN